MTDVDDCDVDNPLPDCNMSTLYLIVIIWRKSSEATSLGQCLMWRAYLHMELHVAILHNELGKQVTV